MAISKDSNAPLPEGQLWPNYLASQIYTGFSDLDLEMICDWGLRGFDQTLPYQTAKWLHWPAELYSFGRCYRDWLGLPSWILLPIYGDHGVCVDGNFSPHERKAKPQIHLTWFDKRVTSIQQSTQKKVLHCPHPWIPFRHKYRLTKKANSKGTIVFLSHTNDGIEIENYNFQKYLDSLLALPAEYHPFVFCIHRHDVEKNYHLDLHKYRIPLISAGETSSPYFVERFYSMISHFNYATSSSAGSQLYYCEEFGVPYFLYGHKPVYINISHSELPLGLLQPDALAKSTGDYQRALFAFPPIASNEKRAHVRSVLGLTADEVEARNQLLKVLPKEYLAHTPEIARLILLSIPRRIFARINAKLKRGIQKIGLIAGQ